MAKKDISIIAGDSYDLGFRVSGRLGPIDLSVPGTLVSGLVLESSGTRMVVPFEVNVTNPVGGEFVIRLSPQTTRQMRGKYIWLARYEGNNRVITLASGALTVKATM